MFPEDDFLLAKPARRESVMIVRIALVALIGCLALLTVLVIQARAEAEAIRHGPAAAVQQPAAPVKMPAIKTMSGV